jgi:hypothetical protein
MKSNTLLIRRLALFTGVGGLILSLSGCLPLAAGAAGGYVAHKEGYRVQSPVTR